MRGGGREETNLSCVALPRGAFEDSWDKWLPTFPFTMFPYYPRHVAVLTETIKKGIHDADSEARSIARK